jgi:hypothetical protein
MHQLFMEGATLPDLGRSSFARSMISGLHRTQYPFSQLSAHELAKTFVGHRTASLLQVPKKKVSRRNTKEVGLFEI